MEDKKKWLFSFVRNFREILDSEEYREYREFFPAFCNTPYLSIEHLEVYNKQGEHNGNIISFYSSQNGDQVKIVKQEESFWGAFFEGVTYGLDQLTDYISKAGDLTDIQSFRKYFEIIKIF